MTAQVGFGIETLKIIKQPLCQIIKTINFNYLFNYCVFIAMITHQISALTYLSDSIWCAVKNSYLPLKAACSEDALFFSG